MKKKCVLAVFLIVIVQTIEIGCLLYLYGKMSSASASMTETQISSAPNTEAAGTEDVTAASEETEDEQEATEKEFPEQSDAGQETLSADETKTAAQTTEQRETTAVKDGQNTVKETIEREVASEPIPPKEIQIQSVAEAPEKTSGPSTQPDKTIQETIPETKTIPKTEDIPETLPEASAEAAYSLYISNAWLDFTPTQYEAFEMSHYHIEVVMSDGSVVADPEGFVAFPQEFHQMLSWVSVTYKGLSYQFEVYAKPDFGE